MAVIPLQRGAETRDHVVNWARRDGADLSFDRPLTKRGVFKWTGRLTSHYPVCSWLRPACAWLKRLACAGDHWDVAVSDATVRCCEDLEAKVASSDPVHGVWNVPSTAVGDWAVFCDASDLAVGVVLQLDGKVIEYSSWLRDANDSKHINVAELGAALRGLTLAAEWKLEAVRLITDSKTVFGWLEQVIGNVCRVKVSGLHKVLVQRRLQIIEDLVESTGLAVKLEWVRSEHNPADRLTRVPSEWLKCQKVAAKETAVGAATVPAVVGPVSREEIARGQLVDADIASATELIEAGTPELIAGPFKKVSKQLVINGGVLCRSVKLPVEGVVAVPVVPTKLVPKVVKAAHCASGHASWGAMYEMLRSRCYFPSIAESCQSHCQSCERCRAASGQRGPAAPQTRTEVPGRPWSVVQIDTLELGAEKSGKFNCVLVCIDEFSTWAEVVPLRRHDAECVAATFTTICCRWGPPDIVRMDNGTEFRNAICDALFQQFGVEVRTGAVRHPQSQGAAERMNRTLITLMRKVLLEASDWKSELELLLLYYRMRPHSATGVAPMVAMTGWLPRDLIVATDQEACSLSAWVTRLGERTARVRDLVEAEFSTTDSVVEVSEQSAYDVGDAVLLRQPTRQRKLAPLYETGWMVKRVVGPSTFVIRHVNGGEKVINADLLKPSPSQPVAAGDPSDGDDTLAEHGVEPIAGRQVYGLRDRRDVRPPTRYA